jgi:hypothetical protein
VAQEEENAARNSSQLPLRLSNVKIGVNSFYREKMNRRHFCSRLRDAEVPADLPGERVGDLGVARHSGAAVVCRIAPPRMTPPFTDRDASMLPQVTYQVMPLHEARLTSS